MQGLLDQRRRQIVARQRQALLGLLPTSNGQEQEFGQGSASSIAGELGRQKEDSNLGCQSFKQMDGI